MHHMYDYDVPPFAKLIGNLKCMCQSLLKKCLQEKSLKMFCIEISKVTNGKRNLAYTNKPKSYAES